ncbi:hypothetical protein JCM7686_2937 [Paracoccus aminophilus JCM 7686]|uniref:Uncharacterized protein n=1 Tax=Paracoccus aminophilus JCM 7686 TaxID=1367847 RepID=S5XXF1_PARAH|nr:hypothetical protein JCM7686_2937 [Paracoccus aminophilus JCM 7686]
MSLRPATSSLRSDDRPSARGHNSTGLSEMSFRKCSGEEAERAWFASLLWRAFPEAQSENDLAERAAEVLTSDRRPVTSRTVRNWLRRENAPHFRYVLKVVALVGAEAVFQIIDPEAE